MQGNGATIITSADEKVFGPMGSDQIWQMHKLKNHLATLAAMPVFNVGNKVTSPETAHKDNNKTTSQT
jgi:hypothetical protein